MNMPCADAGARPDIRIIALDLDGTLLDSGKNLSRRNRAALERAAEKGIAVVPTTGRFFGGMPESVRTLPFVRYAITINGAQVFDTKTNSAIATAEIPQAMALDIMRYLDGFDVIYDCFKDNWGWMTKSLQDKSAEYAPDEHYLKMLLELRTPVPELKAFVVEKGGDVQKVQFFAKDLDLHRRLYEEIPHRFPGVAVSYSVHNNVEINIAAANKGDALAKLAAHLGCGMENTMALGDGLNDLSMVRAAGIGVAMANAYPTVRDAADFVTATNDEDGVAIAIEKSCLDLQDQ